MASAWVHDLVLLLLRAFCTISSLQVRIHRFPELLQTLLRLRLQVLQDVLKVVFFTKVQLERERGRDQWKENLWVITFTKEIMFSSSSQGMIHGSRWTNQSIGPWRSYASVHSVACRHGLSVYLHVHTPGQVSGCFAVEYDLDNRCAPWLPWPIREAEWSVWYEYTCG